MASSAVTVCFSRPSSLSKMQQLFLVDVQLGSSFNYKYIEGRISKLYPLYSDSKNKRMKMILEEGEEAAANDAPPPSKIIVFLTGEFAEEFIQFSVGDLVIISEALIENSPSFVKDSIHPCYIIVEKNRSRPSVWVIPAKKISQMTKAAGRSTAASSAVTRPASTAVASSSTTANRQIPTASNASNDRLRSDPVASLSTVPSTRRSKAAGPSRDTPWSDNVVTTSVHAMDAWTIPNVTLSTNPSPNPSPISTPNSTPTKRSYVYTPLNHLKEANQVNIFGIVKFFKPPYKTRGPDYCMTVTLIGPTLDPDHRGLRCQLFRDDIMKLPQVHAIGDIVRFHRLKVKLFNDAIQGQTGNGFHCLVFDGAVDSSTDPRSSSPSYTLTDDDKRRVKELRLWSSRRTQLALDNRSCTLSKMYAGQYLDLTCQVVSIAVLPTEKCAVIRVWDGTRYKGPVRRMNTSTSVNSQRDEEVFKKSSNLAYDVSLYDNHQETGAQLKPGQFIKLCNLHVAKFPLPGRPDDTAEMVELVLHRGTSYGRGIVALMEWEQGIKDMIKRMEDIEQNAPSTSVQANQDQADLSLVNNAPNPSLVANQIQAGFLSANQIQAGSSSPNQIQAGSSSANQIQAGSSSVKTTNSGAASDTPSRCMQRSASVIIDHFHQRTSHIVDVIASEAPNKFRLRAKVVEYLPHNIPDIVHLYCSKCKFRCRVPPHQKPEPSEKAGTPKKVISTKRASPPIYTVRTNEYNLRSLASKEVKVRKGETTQEICTRSGVQRTKTDSPRRRDKIESPAQRPQRKLPGSGGSSAEESSPGRKRPATTVVFSDEGPTSSSPRKNRRGTSKMAAVSDQGTGSMVREDSGIDSSKQDAGEASEELGKRLTETDVYGRKITAQVQSRDVEGEIEGTESRGHGRKRQKIRVDVDGLTPMEALLMVRLGMRLIHHADVPTSNSHLTIQGANHQSSDSQVFYLCPRCSTVDDTHAVPEDTPVLSEDTPLLQYKYCLKLFLHDGTGRIEVILDRQNAQTFFQGIQATNLHTSLETKYKLDEAMARLCPYSTDTGFNSLPSDETTSIQDLTSHPWLDCCIMSYPYNMGGMEIVKYHMFDTTLALDVE